MLKLENIIPMFKKKIKDVFERSLEICFEKLRKERCHYHKSLLLHELGLLASQLI